MKFNGKLVAGALSAVMTISFASIAAGAVDYSEDPDYGLVADKPANVVTADTIVAAAAEDAVIDVENDKAVVNEEAIAAIANSESTITFVSDNCTISIEDIETVSEIDLGMAIDVVTDEDSDYPVDSIVIAPAQKGEFGMTLVVTIPAAALAELDAETAALYYVADDGTITKMPEEALTFDEDGCAIIRISHASEYVISTVDISTPANNNTTPGADSGNTTNPDTGAVIPMGIAAIAGASAVVAIIAAKKRK